MTEGVGVKTTLCTSCEHKDVCAYKSDYLNIIQAVKNARVSEVKETQWRLQCLTF